jgi:hypothetical protein
MKYAEDNHDLIFMRSFYALCAKNVYQPLHIRLFTKPVVLFQFVFHQAITIERYYFRCVTAGQMHLLEHKNQSRK